MSFRLPLNSFSKNLQFHFCLKRWNALFQVEKYYDYTKDREFLRQNIPILEKEFEYWQNEKTVTVMKNGTPYRMARYVTNSNGPRPESYK